MTKKRSGRPATPFQNDLLRPGIGGAPGSPDEELFRTALFKPVGVAAGKKMRAIDALLESLSAVATKGDVAAIKHLDLVARHRRAMVAIMEAAAAREASPLAALVRKQQRLAAIGLPFATAIYLKLLPEVITQFEHLHGPFELRSAFIPYYVDAGLAHATLSKIERRLRRQRRGQPYEVGYRKPPTASRFTSENNPAMRCREASGWAALDRSLGKPVTIKLANGGQTGSTRAHVSHEQLIRRAIAGDRAARTVVLARMFALERQGTLSPPAHARRKRRVVLDEQLKARIATAEALVTAWMRKDLIALFARNLGSAPPVLDAEIEPPGVGENGPATSPSGPPNASRAAGDGRPEPVRAAGDTDAPARPGRDRGSQPQAAASTRPLPSKKGSGPQAGSAAASKRTRAGSPAMPRRNRAPPRDEMDGPG